MCEIEAKILMITVCVIEDKIVHNFARSIAAENSTDHHKNFHTNIGFAEVSVRAAGERTLAGGAGYRPI